MKIEGKKKLVSMLLMIIILATNLLLTRVIQSVSFTASFTVTHLMESYLSYSEDLTVQEQVYQDVTDERPGQNEPNDPGDAEEPGDEDELPKEDAMENENRTPDEEHLGSVADPVRVVFLGDCMMADNMARALDQHGMRYTLEDFDALLSQADLIVANLETSVGTSRILMDKAFPFQSDPKYLALFEPYREKIIFSLANNHGMDAPLSETLEALDDLNYAYVGVGENVQQAYAPHVIQINGTSFAIFAASQVMPTTDWRAGEQKPGMAEAYNADKLISYITPWMNQVDYTIAYIHWGEELANHPTANQRILEKELREAGVNVIIGSHPHVLQGVEWYGEKQFTAHSMGNFVFTTSHTPVANDTAALEMVIDRDSILETRLHFGRIQFGKVHSMMNSTDRERMIARINELSRSVEVEVDGRLTPVEHWR